MTVFIILFILLTLSGILFIVQAHKQTKTGPRENLITLRFHLRHHEQLSRQVQSALRHYIVTHNAGQQYMYPRITFAKVLQTLREEHNKFLDDAVLRQYRHNNILPEHVTLKKLDRQFRHLLQVQREIQLFTSLYSNPAAIAS